MMNRILIILIVCKFGLFAIDNDNDLVPNNIDKCLNTPDGVFVNKDGCTHEITKIIYFKHASYNIEESQNNSTNEILELIKEGFGYKIILEGHTDSIADQKTNMTLSYNRVNNLKELMLKNNISQKRLTVKWYGETQPISSNITEVDRSKNRRVVVKFR